MANVPTRTAVAASEAAVEIIVLACGKFTLSQLKVTMFFK